MYQFIKDLETMKCPPLLVKERELSADSQIRRKFTLGEADIRPDFAKEYLEQGYVVFPVYRDSRILPLQFGAKFCDYRIINYGDACEIIQEYGKLEMNPQDTRYMKPSLDNPMSRSFRFYYDRTEGRYKQENSEAKWLLRVAEIKSIKESESVNDLVWMFYDFYSDFWIDRVQCRSRFNLDDKPTHLDYMDYIYYLDCQLENVKAYTLLLRIFSELDEEEYQLSVQMVDSLEKQIENCREYLHRNVLEDRFDPKNDALHGKTIEKLHKHINILFKPGFFVDPLKEKLYPNIGQIYDRLQLSRIYNSFETLREKQQNIIIKAKRAFEIQGKTTLNAISDYLVYFVN
ncbi:hypothetical protein BK120_19800 [Paenibacillus sp. FSL A5-0031]|uniref:hypothetical protein n=1 Tax=Paenibacillus sp. FSL A5-0031 TaxID=1920420 RepID=UPI00096D2672|nr:hypothetical protein [Paenibacillus sp. FSL A5-0031]OME80087.1 hypothetical protein BK120_19800 [Paenibacillus sp. FSL A5-0031]